jgi:hypothetical protein
MLSSHRYRWCVLLLSLLMVTWWCEGLPADWCIPASHTGQEPRAKPTAPIYRPGPIPVALLLSQFDSSRFPIVGTPVFGCWLLVVLVSHLHSLYTRLYFDLNFIFVFHCYFECLYCRLVEIFKAFKPERSCPLSEVGVSGVVVAGLGQKSKSPNR